MHGKNYFKEVTRRNFTAGWKMRAAQVLSDGDLGISGALEMQPEIMKLNWIVRKTESKYAIFHRVD